MKQCRTCGECYIKNHTKNCFNISISNKNIINTIKYYNNIKNIWKYIFVGYKSYNIKLCKTDKINFYTFMYKDIFHLDLYKTIFEYIDENIIEKKHNNTNIFYIVNLNINTTPSKNFKCLHNSDIVLIYIPSSYLISNYSKVLKFIKSIKNSVSYINCPKYNNSYYYESLQFYKNFNSKQFSYKMIRNTVAII